MCLQSVANITRRQRKFERQSSSCEAAQGWEALVGPVTRRHQCRACTRFALFRPEQRRRLNPCCAMSPNHVSHGETRARVLGLEELLRQCYEALGTTEQLSGGSGR
jgi:hypothetical protein